MLEFKLNYVSKRGHRYPDSYYGFEFELILKLIGNDGGCICWEWFSHKKTKCKDNKIYKWYVGYVVQSSLKVKSWKKSFTTKSVMFLNNTMSADALASCGAWTLATLVLIM